MTYDVFIKLYVVKNSANSVRPENGYVDVNNRSVYQLTCL